ncbi:gelsolin, cytoplasmic-like isoform X1 [Ornithodoros turicata]|uniref:gelsolin, cytoplasmic-like isoform X1 n=1 Tax=Ornithodoros turicata TaxID=34597 RepID=UPI0031389718
MVATDPAFEGAGQEPGLTIWRIEKLEVKTVDKKMHGMFFSGDSYIVLHTKLPKTGRMQWNIHFWLGRDTSLDEYTVAAIKSVELDESLGGSPVQHREVQDHESDLFLSYFKTGVKYLEGGIESGLTAVDTSVHKRLLQVKGKRNVRVRQVPLAASSMNRGDCFILDARDTIFIYQGHGSGRIERIKAIQIANGIRDDVHGGRSKIFIIDEASSEGDVAQFFEELGEGSAADIKDAEAGGDDVEHERSVDTEVSLHRISDADGDLKVERVGAKPLAQELLDPNDCFLLDGGVSGLFVWVGKGASQKERKESMLLAQKYLGYRGYPTWTKVTRVIGGAEPPMFKQYFAYWKEPEHTSMFGRKDALSKIAAVDKAFNVNDLHREKRRLLSKSLGRACGFMPDDGSGKVEVFRVENFELAPIDPAINGFFFGGDSYVLKYTYNKGYSERYVIYFWQGNESSQDEKAASAIWAVKLDNDLCGKAIQVRVVQGHEPEHFLRIFKGRMIIFTGGHASGFRNLRDHDTYDVDGTRMFHVKGTSDVNVRAVQVAEVAASLNSEDVFVLETPKTTYLWIGEFADESEVAMGRNVAKLVSPDREAVLLKESEEPDEFWQSIGGKGDYQKGHTEESNPLLDARLFKCSTATGKLRVEQMCNFSQEDLDEDDVMMLDSGDEIYIWIGKGSTEEERSKSLEVAMEYVKTDPTQRDLNNTAIITVNQDQEPEGFTSLFDSWDPNLWKSLA